MSDHNYDEKRDFIRMGVKAPLSYTVMGAESQTHYGNSNDLSASGLYMETDFLLSEGDEIEITIEASGNRLLPFIAKGNVLRVLPNKEKKNCYYVSVSLTKIL